MRCAAHSRIGTPLAGCDGQGAPIFGRPHIAAACFVLAALTFHLTPVSADVSFDQTPNTCDQRTVRSHQKAAAKTITRGWHVRNWRKGPKTAQRRIVGRHIACLKRAKHRHRIQRDRAKAKKRLGLYRAYRRIATVRCTRGMYGFWVPIAANTCACIGQESGFSWRAHNPSSPARGAYQLLGHGEPWPANTRRKQLRHYRIAAALPRGAWVAPACG